MGRFLKFALDLVLKLHYNVGAVASRKNFDLNSHWRRQTTWLNLHLNFHFGAGNTIESALVEFALAQHGGGGSQFQRFTQFTLSFSGLRSFAGLNANRSHFGC